MFLLLKWRAAADFRPGSRGNVTWNIGNRCIYCRIQGQKGLNLSGLGIVFSIFSIFPIIMSRSFFFEEVFCDGKTRRNYIPFCEKPHNFLPFVKEEILQHVSCSLISTFSLSLEFLSLQTTDFIFLKRGQGRGQRMDFAFLQAKGPLFFAKVGICVTDFKYLPIILNKQLLYAFSLRMAGNLSGVNQINHTHGSCLFWGRLNVQCRRFELGTGKIHWERLTLIRFLLQVVTGLFVFLSKQGYWSTDSLTSRQQIGWHLQSTAKDYRVFWNKMQFN